MKISSLKFCSWGKIFRQATIWGKGSIAPCSFFPDATTRSPSTGNCTSSTYIHVQCAGLWSICPHAGANWHHLGCRLDKDLAPQKVPNGTFSSNGVRRPTSDKLRTIHTNFFLRISHHTFPLIYATHLLKKVWCKLGEKCVWSLKKSVVWIGRVLPLVSNCRFSFISTFFLSPPFPSRPSPHLPFHFHFLVVPVLPFRLN